MANKKPSKLIGAMVGLLALQGAYNLGFINKQYNEDYRPKGNLTKGTGLSPDQFLFAMAGFREMVAGILWVRADSFFDGGQYDAILPIIRLVTLLDPKQIDVYATGMWHIGYNFTDESERSDRRYLPVAIALGKEGVSNNPQTYELYFETGWLWYHKVKDDFKYAVKYFEEATTKPDMLVARKNLLPKAYLRNNEVDKAIDTYYKLYDDATERLSLDESFGNKQNRETIESNLDNELVRSVQRGYQASKLGTYEKGEYDTKPPFDVATSVKITIPDPKVIKLTGSWNVLPVGCRIVVILRDEEFPHSKPAGMDWDYMNDVALEPQRDVTFLMDDVFIKNRRFAKTLDMSKDSGMYPFLKDKYVFEFYYNPQIAPAHIMDKFGYDGRGMTDSQFLNTSIRPGERVIYGKFEITKDQLLRRGEWSLDGKTPVFKTPNYKESNAETMDDTVLVPSIRNK